MASRPFYDYPRPKEADDLSYTWKEDSNPSLRGIPLVVASALVTNLGFVNKYLWDTTGFGRVKYVKGLDKEVATLKPRVIPVPSGLETGVAVDGILPFGKNLVEPQYADKKGRYYSAADYYALYKSGAATPLNVLEALLPLVQRNQKSPYEAAFITTLVEPVREAARQSTERWAAGQPLGLLDGVPFSVKCDIDVEGYVSTIGLNTCPGDDAFGKRYPCLRTPAKESVWPVQKMLEAGGLLVAQNNMHELGMDTTGCNPTTGTPVNWFNDAYYPGGSSSGAGSSLGAGLIPIALGTDAGGSVRIPPSFNGVFGLKTTHDRTMVMDTSMCIVGPMAGTVADLTAAYRTVAQANPKDEVQGKFAVSLPSPPTASKIIGIPREWVNRSDPVVLDHLKQLIDYYENRLGYEVVDIQIPHLSEGQAAHASTCLSEGFDKARDRTIPEPDKWPVLLNKPNRILMSVSQYATAIDYLKFGQIRTVLMRHLAHLYEKYPGLVIVTPATPFAGWKKTPGDEKYGFTDGNVTLRAMLYVWLANTTGCPSVSCPMGYADPEQGEGRVPMGVLAMGEWGAEEQLLEWAGEAEAYIHNVYPNGRLRPTKWVDVISLAKEKAGSSAKPVDEES